jgi:hypothetical protein
MIRTVHTSVVNNEEFMFCLQGPSETRGTQNEEATHSGTRDVPVETEGESTENEERDEEENSN